MNNIKQEEFEDTTPVKINMLKYFLLLLDVEICNIFITLIAKKYTKKRLNYLDNLLYKLLILYLK